MNDVQKKQLLHSALDELGHLTVDEFLCHQQARGSRTRQALERIGATVERGRQRLMEVEKVARLDDFLNRAIINQVVPRVADIIAAELQAEAELAMERGVSQAAAMDLAIRANSGHIEREIRAQLEPVLRGALGPAVVATISMVLWTAAITKLTPLVLIALRKKLRPILAIKARQLAVAAKAKAAKAGAAISRGASRVATTARAGAGRLAKSARR